jgi:hypothetical protein
MPVTRAIEGDGGFAMFMAVSAGAAACTSVGDAPCSMRNYLKFNDTNTNVKQVFHRNGHTPNSTGTTNSAHTAHHTARASRVDRPWPVRTQPTTERIIYSSLCLCLRMCELSSVRPSVSGNVAREHRAQ